MCLFLRLFDPSHKNERALQPGMRVTVYLKDAPSEVNASNMMGPFVMFGLLQHEHKVSKLNFTVQRNTEYAEPVRSKVSCLLMHVHSVVD